MATSLSAAETHVGVARVLDGDTLQIQGQTIRIWGVDAPESGQLCTKGGKSWRCGQAATEALALRLARQTVSCRQLDFSYNRVVAFCVAGPMDVGSWLVANGWAVEAARFSDGFYSSVERSARHKSLGIWGAEFEAPWLWRQRHPTRRDR